MSTRATRPRTECTAHLGNDIAPDGAFAISAAAGFGSLGMTSGSKGCAFAAAKRGHRPVASLLPIVRLRYHHVTGRRWFAEARMACRLDGQQDVFDGGGSHSIKSHSSAEAINDNQNSPLR